MPDISSSLSKREVNARQNTYTKSEIDLKDGAIQAIAEAAQTMADAAEKKNQEQDQLIAELQKSSHTHSNQDVLDKTEQPYTTAERDKLAGLENYTHPTHTAHAKGFYKFASDGEGHVTDVEKVTKEDITVLGIPDKDTDTTYKLTQYQDLLGSVYAVFYPVVALKDSAGNHTKIVVPNVRTNAQGDLLYNEGYGNLQSTDKYASLGDILFTTPNFFPSSTYNIRAAFFMSYGGLECEVNVYLWSNLNGYEHAEIFTTSELSPQNVKWTVLRSKPGVSEGFGKSTSVIRICVDQESMKKIQSVHGSAYLEYSTGYDGGTVEPVQKADSIDTYLKTFHNDHVIQTDVILSASNASNVAFTGDYNDLSNKPAIPDISGKQDKSTAVTHTANTAVGSVTKPVYVAANGVATAITHSINSDVPANAKFTDTVYTHPTTSGNKHIPAGGSSGQILRWSADGTAVWGADNNTTYSDATQSVHGLMSAADKKKLDDMDLSKYLPLAGGKMTGDIDLNSNRVEVLLGSSPASTPVSTPVAGGYREIAQTLVNATPSLRSFIGSYYNTDNGKKYILISVRHRNGYSDGNANGMLLYSDLESTGDLSWNKQTAVGKWQGVRVFLDSVNFTNYALGKNETAKVAATLTDSGWTATTRDTTFTATSTVKCRKYGQLVEVRGEVTFNSTYGSPTVCTLPAGYRPANVVRACGYTPNGKLFGINVDTAGVVSLPSDSAGTFIKNTTYRIDLTYLLG